MREQPINRSAKQHTEWHPSPALSWVTVFVACAAVDAFLGKWTFLPGFVGGFYSGMIVLSVLTYPMLLRWRAWLGPRGTGAWYSLQAAFWAGSMVGIILLAPWWVSWSWSEVLPLQLVGGLVLAASVAVGGWAAGRMGWGRLCITAALFPPGFPPGAGAQEHGVPQRLVVEGPYRYVRNPLANADIGVIAGTALLTSKWYLVALLVAYLMQLALQLPLEERELRERFGDTYRGYCNLVPHFIPRFKPRDRKEA